MTNFGESVNKIWS